MEGNVHYCLSNPALQLITCLYAASASIVMATNLAYI